MTLSVSQYDQQTTPSTFVKQEVESKSTWWVYLLQTREGKLYCGISTDVVRRIAQHQDGKGARSLRGKGPFELVFHVPAKDQSHALKVEYRIKQLNRKQKLLLIKGCQNALMSVGLMR